MTKHIQLGRKGEEVVMNYLKKKRCKILERNWRHKKDEIDLIVQDKDSIVFVEVKTRSTNYFGEPEEAVTHKKRQFMIRAAEAYVFKNDIHSEIRYDIVSVIIEGNRQTVHHIKDAFYPETYE